MRTATHPGSAWLSAHLHFDAPLHGAEADRVILDLVAPLARHCRQRGWVRRSFFLRYSLDGNHLRFRLLGAPDVLAARVRPALLTRAAAAQGVEVRWVPYEPELERYGGHAGVEVAEDLFDASSRTAVALLTRLGAGGPAARRGYALAAMVIGLEVFVGDRGEASGLARTYAESYLRQLVPREAIHAKLAAAFERGLERQDSALPQRVDALWRAAAAGEGLPAELAEYRRDLASVRRRLRRRVSRGELSLRGGTPCGDWSAAVRQLLPSYLHMMANRLGVQVVEECFLSRVVADVLAPAGRAERAGGAA